MRLPVCLFVFTAALATLCAPAFAKTVQVNPDPGNTPIGDAVTQLEDGDKLILNAGTYDERLTLVDLNKIKVLCRGDVVFDGVGPAATISVTNCTKVKMQGFMILNAPSQGVIINGCDKVNFKGSEIVDHATQGIQVVASTKVSIVGNLVQGGTNGIQVLGDSVVNISKNTVSGPSSEGIFQLATALPGSVIRGNRVEGSGNAGIAFDGTGNKVEKNTVDNCLFGIVTPFGGTDMTGSSMSKNRVSNTAVALRTYATGGIVISKNTVENATGSALQITKTATDTIVSKNKVLSAVNGIDDEGVRSNVSKNKVAGTTNYGIRARGTDGEFTKNTVNDTAGAGFDLWTAGNTLTKNKANGNGDVDLDSDRQAEDQNTFDKNKFGTSRFLDVN